LVRQLLRPCIARFGICRPTELGIGILQIREYCFYQNDVRSPHFHVGYHSDCMDRSRRFLQQRGSFGYRPILWLFCDRCATPTIAKIFTFSHKMLVSVQQGRAAESALYINRFQNSFTWHIQQLSMYNLKAIANDSRHIWGFSIHYLWSYDLKALYKSIIIIIVIIVITIINVGALSRHCLVKDEHATDLTETVL